MKFAPKTEQEIAESNLLPKGQYGFEITNGEDAVSKSGNEMIKLWVTVFDANGGQNMFFDYLLESMAFKLRHAADACGLLAKYESGELVASDFIGKTGQCKVGIEPGKPREDGSGDKYPDKNRINDYVASGASATPSAARPGPGDAPMIDDEIPF